MKTYTMGRYRLAVSNTKIATLFIDALERKQFAFKIAADGVHTLAQAFHNLSQQLPPSAQWTKTVFEASGEIAYQVGIDDSTGEIGLLLQDKAMAFSAKLDEAGTMKLIDSLRTALATLQREKSGDAS